MVEQGPESASAPQMFGRGNNVKYLVEAPHRRVVIMVHVVPWMGPVSAFQGTTANPATCPAPPTQEASSALPMEPVATAPMALGFATVPAHMSA